MARIDARWLLTGDGWQSDAWVELDSHGRLLASGSRSAGGASGGAPLPTSVVRQVDLLVPALPNAHCHAFQFGIAGLTERRAAADASGHDDFWTWREQMYAAVAALDAERLRQVAERLYRRLRARGYGQVAEFHYVHRLAGDGPLDTAGALIEAARAAGMPLLLLPVLYRQGGIDGRPLSPRQQPFSLSLDAYGELLQRLVAANRSAPGVAIGIAPHSLRAVSASDLAEVLAIRAATAPNCPVHLHVSEQRAEVDEALAVLGTTPIAWLLDHAPVDGRWCLVHATHATPAELGAVATAGATICLCPTTEANLADGPFPIEDWWARGGLFAIGSDSNVGTDPGEELRWLEYQARLRLQRRSVLVEPGLSSVGPSLWRRAVRGGRRALGRGDDPLSADGWTTLLAITREDPALAPDVALDDWLFAQRVTRGDPA